MNQITHNCLSGLFLLLISIQPGLAANEWYLNEATENPRDPWEHWNRKVYAFNETMDTYIAKPVARTYDRFTPSVVQAGVLNFFINLASIKVIANDLFQLKWSQAGSDSARFLLNSVFGLAGVIDVAAPLGFEYREEDFGQTLGYWNVPIGPYLMLPLVGPSTVRDFSGWVTDFTFSPLREVDSTQVRVNLKTIDLISYRASLLKAEAVIQGDSYAFIRDAYLQRRDYLVKDGQVEDIFLEDDF